MERAESGRTLWVIVTPVYPPAIGGGAVYTWLLARALASEGIDVQVLTEAYPDRPPTECLETGGGRILIERCFPYRAGRPETDFRSYVAYARQMLDMLTLPRRIRAAADRLGASRVVCLVHFSLFYKPNPLWAVLDRIRAVRPGGVRLVADLRDPMFTEKHRGVLKRFDAAIGCSRQIADDLRALVGDSVTVAHIPIPFDRPPAPDEAAVADAVTRYGLARGRYVFNPNGVVAPKAYPELREAVRALRGMDGTGDVALVTCGRRRNWTDADTEAANSGLLRYLGPIPHADVLALARGAMLTAIVSRKEGLPRSALDVLSAGGLLLAPPIPEFEEAIPDQVARSLDPQALARQMQRLAQGPSSGRYDLSRHDIRRLVAAYRALEGETTIMDRRAS